MSNKRSGLQIEIGFMFPTAVPFTKVNMLNLLASFGVTIGKETEHYTVFLFGFYFTLVFGKINSFNKLSFGLRF